MDNIVKKLFEAGLLSEDDQKSLQESFDNRIDAEVAALRESVETQLREEMAQRFEHDKATLVEAMDRMLTDVVQKYESAKVAEAAKLREAQARYDAAVKEARTAYKTRVKEHAQVLESFVMKKLSAEISEFNEDKTAVADMRLKLAEANATNKSAYKKRMNEQMALMRKFVVEKLDGELVNLREQKQALAEQRIALSVDADAQRKQIAETMAARVAKIDKFVVGQVSKELREFQEDKQALVNKKVELVTEARKKLAETQRNFVREAAKLVDKKVTESMKVEMTQLHEDLERNRQNMFGRRIFEAVATEFMTSYFSEGTEVKKLEKVLESKDQEMLKLKRKLQESQQATDAAARKSKLAEETSARTRIMSELLAPLGRDKRAVMQELLESVKTPALRESYNKYLPAILNEGSKKVATPSRQSLTETANAKPKSCVAITGDQRNNRLQEAVETQESDVVSVETAQILKLAGITK